MVSFDVAGQRVAELRILDIAARQLLDGRFITPQAHTVVSWRTMTQDSVPQSTWPQAWGAFTRRHFLPFLLSLERRSDAVTRWLGLTTLNGKPHDAVSVTDADGAVFTLMVDRQTHLPTRIEQLVTGSSVGDTVDALRFRITAVSESCFCHIDASS